jgi:hypothetical protein
MPIEGLDFLGFDQRQILAGPPVQAEVSITLKTLAGGDVNGVDHCPSDSV